ncbi:putative lysosomal acid lipase/cholesteryl ester hydrolase [Ciconia boyciana]|uniref:putative lysosomal acid lipase/cholesteryl ester hydrolase n=1 Tax=Ciconia boyciana TaxID=52775 RepID=UPI003B9E0208
MNISQIIYFHGYRSKEHQVPTDGYFLTMNWIPGGREEAGSRRPRLPVLLQHGLVLDGSNWVSSFSNNSLGFILADARYDFCIRNSRGNSWSLWYLNLSVSQEEFWDFSFHEMSTYDLPTMVGFIPRKTVQEKLFYVSHTQGSSLGFMEFLSMPQLAEKIKIFFVVGPAYTLCTDKGPVLSLFYLPHAIIKVIFGRKEGALLGQEQRAALARVCSCWMLSRVCTDGLFLVGGFNEKNLHVSTLDMYISHFPDYTSTKNLLHWGQTAKTGEFKQFDYGERNQEKYSQTSPPFYRIENMTVPTALWSGGEDWFTSTLETQCLLLRITNLVHHEHFPDWNH